ncbi:DUF4231 domain-containing protein [Nocardia pseudovaccinii]|uniref:DUF4231 domain-containing protein n=1 Tax=Nocardia pseudovaccinii TaxID=189540 RepID=UPI003D94EA3A
MDEERADPVWERLVGQLNWYGAKSAAAQRAYKQVKLGQIVVGAVVPVVALSAPAVVTAVLAAVVVVAEGAQQLFQWQTNWLGYRSTAEALKHERFLYLAEAGPYRDVDRRAVLAERVENLLGRENVEWVGSNANHPESS